MKVQVIYTVEVEERDRRALRAANNQPGKATRDEIRAILQQRGTDGLAEAREARRQQRSPTRRHEQPIHEKEYFSEERRARVGRVKAGFVRKYRWKSKEEVNKDVCSYKKCSNETALTILGWPLCRHHWEEECKKLEEAEEL